MPEALHHQIKSRAALEGTSLSEYLLRELERIAAKPTLAEVMSRLAEHEPLDYEQTGGNLIRADRPA